MNLHEAMLADLDRVFFNLDEFACEHCLDGRVIRCLVDDTGVMAATKALDNLDNAAGIGILQCDRLVLCKAEDLSPLPLPGQELEMDGRRWLVADTGLAETEGLLALPLNRAF